MADFLSNATKLPSDTHPHPFYPLEANIVGYLANEWSVPKLLGVFFAGCAVELGITLMIVNRFNPKLRNGDKAALLWFVVSGTIHLFFEGYFAYNHATMPAMQDPFGQMWKEYAYSDSRYMSSDAFVLCMETSTAIFWGPLSYTVVWMIATQHSLRYPLQALVSLGQIYGDVLYYATSLFDHYFNGITYFRPEAYYFWAYYFFLNFIWIVIPGILLVKSIRATSRAFLALEQNSKGLQSNGKVKKTN